MATHRVGVIGCGNIFDVYMANSKVLRSIEIVACASQNGASAAEKAAEHGIAAMSVPALLAAPDIDIVLILTPSPSHAPLATAALEAGKHVYMEKTIAVSVDEARQLLRLANERKLRVGVAPDTVLGAAVQRGRHMIDSGRLGDMIFGTAAILTHGMEAWHPNPEPFYGRDVGPVMDSGPYPVTTLVTLLGPVKRVTARGRISNAERMILAEGSPRRGERFAPQGETSIMAVLEFASGAMVNVMLSWDVWRHGQPFFELHGTEGSLRLPHYNWFGGELMLSARGEPWETIGTGDMLLGIDNWQARTGMVANYRGIGLAEMAHAIDTGRPHRADGQLALHVLDVLATIMRLAAGDETDGAIGSSFTRAEILAEEEIAALF